MASNSATLESAQATGRGGKYLTFALGNEGYGIRVERVLTIVQYMTITAVPRVPGYVKGVINLRGQVISVIDLRAKFGMEEVPPSDATCIVVVETQHGGRKLSTGLVVDKVSEVPMIGDEQIEDAPSFGTSVDTQFILGMGKIGDQVKILLDIDRVLDAESADWSNRAAAA